MVLYGREEGFGCLCVRYQQGDKGTREQAGIHGKFMTDLTEAVYLAQDIKSNKLQWLTVHLNRRYKNTWAQDHVRPVLSEEGFEEWCQTHCRICGKEVSRDQEEVGCSNFTVKACSDDCAEEWLSQYFGPFD